LFIVTFKVKKRRNKMSLYSEGLKTSPKSRVGAEGAPPISKEPFEFPPKNSHHALLMQKAYCFTRNGYMKTFRDIRDTPYTNLYDGATILKYWHALAPENKPTALKKAFDHSRTALHRAAAAYLGIPFEVLDTPSKTPGEMSEDFQRIINLLTLKDAIIRMNERNTYEFWKGIYRIDHELRNLPPDVSGWDIAWQSVSEAWDELPDTLNRWGKFAADTLIKPVAGAAGTGLGAFFNGLFQGLKSPVGIIGAGIVGYVGYNYFKSRKAPIFVINKKPSTVKEKIKAESKGK
jgi:hypothetical protein